MSLVGLYRRILTLVTCTDLTALGLYSQPQSRFSQTDVLPGGGGVFPENLGRGVQPPSQNPYPIYDQNLQFSLPYL